MKVLVVLNGISGGKKFFYHSILPSLQKVAAIEVKETQRAGHAELLAQESVKENFDIVLAAGGDGTLSQVINGILKCEGLLPTVGLIPLGTGNDFARSVGIKANANLLVSLLQKNQPKRIDIGRAAFQNERGQSIQRNFVNVCSLGMGPEAVRRIQNDRSYLGPGLIYLKAIISTFLNLQRPSLHIQSEKKEWVGKACVFAVANGNAFGHGVFIAPDAQLNDGYLNTFLAGDFPTWRFLMYLQLIKSGKKVKDSKIEYGTTRSVEVKSENPLLIEADGELIGFTPLKCEVESSAISFLY
jgi:diacylglycerol kinase (ATP)